MFTIIDDQLFKKLAMAFETASHYSYEFTVGKGKNTSFIISSLNIDEFTHIIGLDHISNIKNKIENNTVLKKSIFKKIIRGDFKYSDLSSNDLKEICSFIHGTFNTLTNLEYTIEDRLLKLVSINDILDDAYTGKLYKWNKKLCQTRLPNGNRRNISITADYLLKIPSNENPQEYYNLFLIQTNKQNYNKNDPIKLLLISAFPDCVDLSSGQERPYTILRETKVNKKTKEKVQIFVHPRYIEI